MKVRLCDKNKGKGKVEKKLRETFPELDVKVKNCLDLCSDCDKSMIAKVDGKKVVAEDKDALCRKIAERLEKK